MPGNPSWKLANLGWNAGNLGEMLGNLGRCLPTLVGSPATSVEIEERRLDQIDRLPATLPVLMRRAM